MRPLDLAFPCNPNDDLLLEPGPYFFLASTGPLEDRDAFDPSSMTEQLQNLTLEMTSQAPLQLVIKR
jgi:hypothetical protein